MRESKQRAVERSTLSIQMDDLDYNREVVNGGVALSGLEEWLTAA